MNWVWINSDAQLAEVLTELAAEPAVAVDTEFRRRDTFFPQVGLLQLSWGDTAFLIDPLAVDSRDALATWLTDPSQVKVLHSASEDLEVFERWLGVLPTPLFDTQKAAAMLGLGFGLSYRDLVQNLIGETVSKEETQSDWLARPLSDAQCDYAAQDVIYLFRCWALLRDQAHARGRYDWILEEGGHLGTGGRGPLAKFRSAWKLKPPQLATLLALIDWRETEARRRDRPRSWILNDKVLGELARRLPEATAQLGAIEGMPPGLIRREGDTLIALIRAAVAAASTHPPTPLPGPLSARQKHLVRALADAHQARSDALAVAPEVVLASRDLELLAREATGEPVVTPASWTGWRAATFVAPLRELAAQIAAESAQ